MKKFGIVIKDWIRLKNFKLRHFIIEVLPKFIGITIYSRLAQSAYQNWLPSHSAIKVL